MAKQDEVRELERSPSTDFETESLAPPRYTEFCEQSYGPRHDSETVEAALEEPYHIRGEHIPADFGTNSTDLRSCR